MEQVWAVQTFPCWDKTDNISDGEVGFGSTTPIQLPLEFNSEPSRWMTSLSKCPQSAWLLFTVTLSDPHTGLQKTLQADLDETFRVGCARRNWFDSGGDPDQHLEPFLPSFLLESGHRFWPLDGYSWQKPYWKYLSSSSTKWSYEAWKWRSEVLLLLCHWKFATSQVCLPAPLRSADTPCDSVLPEIKDKTSSSSIYCDRDD